MSLKHNEERLVASVGGAWRGGVCLRGFVLFVRLPSTLPSVQTRIVKGFRCLFFSGCGRSVLGQRRHRSPAGETNGGVNKSGKGLSVRKDGTRRNKQVPVLLRGDLREKGTERARGREGREGGEEEVER